MVYGQLGIGKENNFCILFCFYFLYIFKVHFLVLYHPIVCQFFLNTCTFCCFVVCLSSHYLSLFTKRLLFKFNPSISSACLFFFFFVMCLLVSDQLCGVFVGHLYNRI